MLVIGFITIAIKNSHYNAEEVFGQVFLSSAIEVKSQVITASVIIPGVADEQEIITEVVIKNIYKCESDGYRATLIEYKGESITNYRFVMVLGNWHKTSSLKPALIEMFSYNSDDDHSKFCITNNYYGNGIFEILNTQLIWRPNKNSLYHYKRITEEQASYFKGIIKKAWKKVYDKKHITESMFD